MQYKKLHPIERLIRKPIAKEWRRIRAILREANNLRPRQAFNKQEHWRCPHEYYNHN
jgi:hypothetical protein